MRKSRLLLALAAFLLVTIPALSACSTPAETPTTPTPTPEPVIEQTLTVYSGRSEALIAPIIDQFSKISGIKVQVRYGSTSEIAAAILEEGKNSPADVFFAQDPGGLGAVEHLFTTIPTAILDKVNAKFRSPEGKWVGISGRARVLVYNTNKLTEADLPDDIWDLTDPKWKDRIGWAPTNASFQAMVTGMRAMWGEDKTKQWLQGILANNPKTYSNNTGQVTAAASGEIDIGMPNHYYLYRFLNEQGESYPARNYHPRAGGPGAAILVAGAGILETSKNKESAQKFLDFMLSTVGQQYFAGQTFEYPVIEGVTIHSLLTPIEEINIPDISMAQMADLTGTLAMLRETGVLP